MEKYQDKKKNHACIYLKSGIESKIIKKYISIIYLNVYHYNNVFYLSMEYYK